MGEKEVCFGEEVRGLQGAERAIRGDERVFRRAAGGVFRQMGDGAQRLRECRGERWFRFDSAKVGLCRGRGAVAETLHGEEPKVGARALQGLGRGEKGRGGQTEMGSHAVGTGRRHGTKGHKKGPTAGSGSGRRGIGREVHLTLRRSSAALASPLAAACER